MVQATVRACRATLDKLEQTGSYMRFSFGEASIGYYCDDPEALNWLRRFFAGYFASSMLASTHAWMYCVCDSTLYKQLCAYATREGQKLDARCVVARGEQACYFLLVPERKLLLVANSQEAGRAESLQAVRSLMKWLLIERGWLPFNAACCSKNAQAICLVGGERVEPVLLNLMARHACDLVSNERLLLYDKGHEVLVCGLPGSFELHVEALRAFPQVLQWLESAPSTFFPRASLTSISQLVFSSSSSSLPEQSPNADQPRAEEVTEANAETTPLLASELTALFGVAIEPLAQLKLFLLPTHVETPDTIMRQISDAHASLLAHYAHLTEPSENYLRHCFAADDELLQDRLASLLQQHTARIPTYELYQDNEEATSQIITRIKAEAETL